MVDIVYFSLFCFPLKVRYNPGSRYKLSLGIVRFQGFCVFNLCVVIKNNRESCPPLLGCQAELAMVVDQNFSDEHQADALAG